MQTAVLASLVGFPGLGQLMQKRWVAGLIFSLAFGMALTFFLLEVGGIIAAFYRFASDFENAAVPDIPLSHVFISFTAAMAVFVTSAVDVVRAQARIDRRGRVAPAPPSHGTV